MGGGEAQCHKGIALRLVSAQHYQCQCINVKSPSIYFFNTCRNFWVAISPNISIQANLLPLCIFCCVPCLVPFNPRPYS